MLHEPIRAVGRQSSPLHAVQQERLTVSQSVPEPGQQSVRQKHTVWVFCQWQMRPQAVGKDITADQAVAERYGSRSMCLGAVVRTPAG